MGTATDKQIGFLRKLMDERVYDAPDGLILAHRMTQGTLSIADASRFIDKLMKAPRKTVTPFSAAAAALEEVEVSFYAVPAAYVIGQSIDLLGNDYLFLRVRNYMGKRYLSRVHGAPDRPRYSRVDARSALYLASVIKGRHEEFSALWHEHSGRCGRCNATLTDKTSREYGIGPECRKAWGH